MSYKSAYEMGGDSYELTGGGGYPPPGGVGADILFQTLAGVYDASNRQGFSFSGEWFSGLFVPVADKLFQLIGTLLENATGTAEFNIGIYNFAGNLLAQTGKFVGVNGANTAFLDIEVQLIKGMPYRFAIWGEENVNFFFKNGLSGINTSIYSCRSNGNASDLPTNLFTNFAQSPIYPYGIMF